MDGQYFPEDEMDIDSLASSEPPQQMFQPFSEGGEVEDIDHYARGGEVTTEDMTRYVLSDDEDATPSSVESTSFTTSLPAYYGGSESADTGKSTAKAMLKKLTSKGGGKSRPKSMGFELEGLAPSIPELGASKTEQEKLMQIASARSQYDALEKAYKLRAQAAQRAGRGLMRPTFNAASLESPTLEKAGPLMARTFAKGGEADKKDQELTGINRVTDFVAQRLPASSFPTSARTLLETVQGKRGPITESNFSPEELNAMREIIALKGGDKGGIQYGDYQTLAKVMKARGQIPASTTPSLFSMADPLGNVQTTLGRFKYGRDAKGNLIVQDTYDFNPPQDPNSMQEQRTAEYGVMGPYRLIREYAGEKIPPGRGREININLGKPVKRADGSPPGGERLTPQQIEQLAAEQAALNTYQPVVNRNIQRQGMKSRALAQSRDVNQLPDPQTYAFIEGMLGASPQDVADKFSVFHPKRKEILGRAEQGFVTGNATLVGPAARMLKEVGTPAVKYLGMEAARQVERGMFNEGPLRAITPQPAFAVRPEGGGTTFTGARGSNRNEAISKFDKMIDEGANPRIEGLSNEMGDAIENFWRSKAQNYFTRQYGTPSDPIFNQIISGKLTTPALQRSIPDYALEQTRVGKTRVNPETGESRFYPTYPQALEDLTRNYDEMTGLQGIVFNVKEPIFDPNYAGSLSTRGTQLEQAAREEVVDKMVAGGLNPDLINPKVSITGPRQDPTEGLLNYVPGEYKELYSLYKTPAEETNKLNQLYKELGVAEDASAGIPENLRRAIETSEPIYDINFLYKSPLKDLLAPNNINRYLATLSPAEIKNMRFDDVVKNSARYNLDMFNTQNLVNAIQSGKRVPNKVWTQGISDPLMTLEKEGQEGGKFTWHRILDNEATAVEGAYIGHSVGGYAKGGNYGPREYRLFKEGKKQVYTLRDSRGKPFTTVEVEMVQTNPEGRLLTDAEVARAKERGTPLGDIQPVVRQIKGNGAKTGNVPAKDVEDQVFTFVNDYLKPSMITESDSYLTPKLEKLKMQLSGRPSP